MKNLKKKLLTFLSLNLLENISKLFYLNRKLRLITVYCIFVKIVQRPKNATRLLIRSEKIYN